MNILKKQISLFIIFSILSIFFIACKTVQPPVLTEAEKAIVLIQGFGEKESVEIKRLTEKCRPIGPLEYIPGQYEARKKAVEMKADTVHFYYYDDVRNASIVRFWVCR
ncbi:MAG TPA: hypothetical protein PK358_10200 [Spirochaetota bacterium]|nr:hypothetical protein [Spirochaetota bacterium]HPJ35196.1 hypothetical protein [Spirochaetota bacterium]